MGYQDVNAATVDRWVAEGWEWGLPVDHGTYMRAKAGFTLLAFYEDINATGRLHDLNVPTFLAMRSRKPL